MYRGVLPAQMPALSPGKNSNPHGINSNPQVEIKVVKALRVSQSIKTAYFLQKKYCASPQTNA